MSKLFIDILVRLGVIQPKTTASILFTFQKAIDDLEEVAASAEADTIDIAAQQKLLKETALAASLERTRALNVQTRLKELVAP